MKQKRSSGVLLHPTSLPGNSYCGTLGKAAYRFVDFLEATNQTYWQILPLGPTGFGNSPYQCYSAFAGNELLIDHALLVKDGMLKKSELEEMPRGNGNKADFDRAIEQCDHVLSKAFKRFNALNDYSLLEEYRSFLGEHGWWLNDYALFMAYRKKHGEIPWSEWDTKLANRDQDTWDYYRWRYNNDYELQRFIQFLFFRQWYQLKRYANDKGIEIFGDLPLYVALDSADVWANQKLFMLDKHNKPTLVGGVPPDYFSEDGQLWGNPVYNWKKLKKHNYDWWIARLHFNLRMFDLIRIDHFRGFESFWAIPANAETAKKGEWLKADGYELFSLLKSQIGNLPIIAEDLGEITPEVTKLRDHFKLPGMKVLQFAFASDATNEHLPHNHRRNFVTYTGTHDNNTTMGWYNDLTTKEKKNVNRYIPRHRDGLVKSFIKMAWASTSNMAIVPLQDLLELGDHSRMNTPGTAQGNWTWRFEWNELKKEHTKFLRRITQDYNRENPQTIKSEKSK
ncbi:4-alpha-glucanotransferase [Puteibacter caeruleilacunae]|nr:4-alpha-glucanotransferase [Puteibacter caeruleilacunae]